MTRFANTSLNNVDARRRLNYRELYNLEPSVPSKDGAIRSNMNRNRLNLTKLEEKEKI